MKVTISGVGGSGKSTVAKLVAKRLGYTSHSVGDFRGEVAKKHNMTIDALNKVGETEDWTDKEADAVTKAYGEQHDNFVVEGRLAYHFIRDSVKIFLDVDLAVAAQRIYDDQRDDEAHQDTVEGVERMLEIRMQSNKERYQKWYGLDYLDRANYDLVIDTSQISVDEVVQRVIDFLDKV